MAAMGIAKGVIDKDIGKRGQFLRKAVVVFFLFGVKAQVLEHDHVPRAHVFNQLLHVRPSAIGSQRYLLVQKPGQPLRDGGQTELGDRFALGTAKMRHDNDPGVLIQGVIQRG